MEGIEELQRASAGRTSQSNDVCHYSLYFPAQAIGATSIESLQALTAAILEYVQQLCRNVNEGDEYIWQREPFSLRPAAEKVQGPTAGFCLQGATNIGESVEDEWWIVWLLQEISKKWKEAVIEIHDNDGQFLLIEAAEVLPGWLNPDNADNRLWISAGNLHLIPPQAVSPQAHSEGQLTLAAALAIMFDPSKKASTVASEAIRTAIGSRATAAYNQAKTEHTHRTIAYLPDEIIRLLQYEPSLITKAATTFYERDAIQLKACQYMRRFRPSPAHYATVRMTRALYAQLASQRFYAPKPFERAGWLSVSANEDPSSPQSIEHRRRDIGMKIACGFEMLYQEEKDALSRQGQTQSATKIDIPRPGRRSDVDTSASTSGNHMSQNQAYLKYIVALTDRGYFQGETAGSSLYNQLEARAKQYWQTMQEDRAGRGGNLAEHMDELTADKAQNELPQQEVIEDSDAWLYIDESRLEDMLGGKPDRAPASEGMGDEGLSPQEREENMAKTEAARLQNMASKFTSFLDGEGSLEGAMFDDDEDLSDDEDDEAEDAEDGEGLVAGPSMPTEEKEKRLAKLVPALGDAEWGSAAANQARLDAKRKEDAEKASSKVSQEHSEMLKTAAASMKGPTKEDMQTAMRAAGLGPKEKYDGDDSSDEDGDDEDFLDPQGPSSKPRLLNKATLEEVSDEEDAQLEFGDGEQDDFLKFAREALGLTESQYEDILKSREKRGAFVPTTWQQSKDSDELPRKKKVAVSENDWASSPSKPSQRSGEIKPAQAQAATQKQPNSRLDNFESLMSAMDEQLQKSRKNGSSESPQKPATRPTTQKTSMYSNMVVDDDNASDDGEDDFDFADLDAELAAALKRDESESGPADYTLIKNFLESFKSQNGQAGPVSNVFGRLDKDFSMPRDS